MKRISYILIVLMIPVLLQAKEYTFETEGCAITIPDSGWTEIPISEKEVNKIIKIKKGTSVISIVVLPMFPHVSIDDPNFTNALLYSLRAGNQESKFIDVTSEYLTIGGNRAYAISGKIQNQTHAVPTMQVYILANGKSYNLSIVAADRKIEDDPEFSQILHSFRIFQPE